ncbi:TPA: hypothetical protein DEP90_00435 [Patescibacteria group bacterium]|nr:hypothetical protein [Patescibacteria group bacterium]
MEIPDSQSEKHVTISISMIVKDEEEMLGRALESVKEADEIVIADTGSADNTIEIAKKYTDKIYTEYVWKKHFAEARNFSKNKCTKDWILVIDADEQLDSSFKEVRAVIKKADKLNKDFVYFKVKAKKKKTLSSDNIRAFRNIPEIEWKGAAHNYLVHKTRGKNKETSYYSSLRLGFYYSPTHAKYPKRTLDILEDAVAKDPNLIREKFYLAREHAYFKDYTKAIYWFDEYLKNSHFRGEIAEAYLQKARCLWLLRKGEEARISCMYAIMTNPDFKEALIFMAEMNFEPRKSKWLKYSQLAKNENVLFVRTTEEKGKDYYDKLFETNRDMSRYKEIYEKITELVEDKSVLDIGCGLAELSKYIEDYEGFDFSKKAVEIANNKNVRLGNVYDIENYVEKDVYICTEVLEHVEDLRLIKNIPQKSRFIFSVPSFADVSHLRVYDRNAIKKLPLKIKKIYRFNWTGKKWSSKYKSTSNYILLVDSYTL